MYVGFPSPYDPPLPSIRASLVRHNYVTRDILTLDRTIEKVLFWNFNHSLCVCSLRLSRLQRPVGVLAEKGHANVRAARRHIRNICQ